MDGSVGVGGGVNAVIDAAGARALVVGYGSIGQRHARVLAGIGCEVAVVSRRAVDHPRVHGGLPAALAACEPAYVVVADRTAEHRDTLAVLATQGYCGRVLVEKPLFGAPAALPEHRFAFSGVAYNLRFHPLVQHLRELLRIDERVVSANFYVGQYLPQWRPGSDYRTGYSARRSEGGGVLRDLSHELDLATWLLGDWTRLTAHGGHFSPLEIDSDDSYVVLMSTARCPSVTVQMNYLDRRVKREVVINTACRTLCLDFVAGTLAIDGEIAFTAAPDRDHTYRAEHLAMLAGDMSTLCTLAEGHALLATMAAAEVASCDKKWMEK